MRLNLGGVVVSRCISSGPSSSRRETTTETIESVTTETETAEATVEAQSMVLVEGGAVAVEVVVLT